MKPLTILNSHDEKLPMHASIDDFLVSYQEQIPNKYYQINGGSHFTTFLNHIQMNLTTTQVHSFIYEIKKQPRS